MILYDDTISKALQKQIHKSQFHFGGSKKLLYTSFKDNASII